MLCKVYEARMHWGDQVLYSWWSCDDEFSAPYDTHKVRELEAKGYIVKAITLERG